MVLTIRLDGADKRIGWVSPATSWCSATGTATASTRPACTGRGTGEVQYFDVWPTVEQQSYQPAATDQAEPEGRASLAPGEGSGRAPTVGWGRRRGRRLRPHRGRRGVAPHLVVAAIGHHGDAGGIDHARCVATARQRRTAGAATTTQVRHR